MSIYTFVFEGYADWEIAHVLPALARKHQLKTFGMTAAPVRSLGMLTTTPDLSIDQVDLSDVEALILPGGDAWLKADVPALDALVKAARVRRMPVAAICAATAYLARLGMLDDVPHTGNGIPFMKWAVPTYQGEAHFRSGESAVNHEGLITASGLAPLHFGHAVLSELAVFPAEFTDRWFDAFAKQIPFDDY